MTTIGKIYNDNCGHCVRMAPDWEKMKEELKNTDIVIKEFETAKQSDELKKYTKSLKKQTNQELTYDGVPTIFKVSENKIEYYSGERSPEKMAAWAKSSDKSHSKVHGGKKSRRVKGKKRTSKTYKKRLDA